MSVEDNKANIRRLVEETINKGDLSVADEIIAPDYVYHFPGMDFKGTEGFKQFITIQRTAFPDLHVTIDEMIAEGNMVATRFKISGTMKGELMGIPPTGKKMNIVEALFIRFENGKNAEATPTIDQLEMFQQLGVSPPGQ